MHTYKNEYWGKHFTEKNQHRRKQIDVIRNLKIRMWIGKRKFPGNKLKNPGIFQGKKLKAFQLYSHDFLCLFLAQLKEIITLSYGIHYCTSKIVSPRYSNGFIFLKVPLDYSFRPKIMCIKLSGRGPYKEEIDRFAKIIKQNLKYVSEYYFKLLMVAEVQVKCMKFFSANFFNQRIK